MQFRSLHSDSPKPYRAFIGIFMNKRGKVSLRCFAPIFMPRCIRILIMIADKWFGVVRGEAKTKGHLKYYHHRRDLFFVCYSHERFPRCFDAHSFYYKKLIPPPQKTSGPHPCVILPLVHPMPFIRGRMKRDHFAPGPISRNF